MAFPEASSDIFPFINKVLTTDSLADKSDRVNYAEIKSDFSRDLQAAKVLASGQEVVKTAIENQADSPDEGEMYEPVCESSPRAPPRANCSFLWSNHRAKNFPDKSDASATCHATKENDEGVDSEEYDDIGPSNFVAQAVRIMHNDSVIRELSMERNLRANVIRANSTKRCV